MRRMKMKKGCAVRRPARSSFPVPWREGGGLARLQASRACRQAARELARLQAPRACRHSVMGSTACHHG